MRRLRIVTRLTLPIVMALTFVGAAPADGRALLQRGIELYREASYAASVAALESARQKGGLEAPERVECAFYLGASYVALGALPAARRELKAALQEDREYEPPQYTSPKVAALFAEVRGELERGPRLRALVPERHGDVLTLRFEASRTSGRAFAAVEWRWRGAASWREAPLLHVGNELHATVPVEQSGQLEYYAEGYAPAGAIAAGSAERPIELPVSVGPRPQPQPRRGGCASTLH